HRRPGSRRPRRPTHHAARRPRARSGAGLHRRPHPPRYPPHDSRAPPRGDPPRAHRVRHRDGAAHLGARRGGGALAPRDPPRPAPPPPRPPPPPPPPAPSPL